MDEARFTIKTVMEREDYRRFLYIATFFKNKTVIPVIALIALVGSLVMNGGFELSNWRLLLISWLFMFSLAVAVICFKVEQKNRQRIATDKTGAFEAVSILSFYDDRLVMNIPALKSTGELRYDQIFQILETRDYIIFYITANQASLIRKRDIEAPEFFRQFIISKFAGRYKKLFTVK